VLDDIAVSGQPEEGTPPDPEPVTPVVAEEEPVAEDEEPDPASEAGKTLAAKKHSYQTRINELTAKQRQAERERDEARQEAAKLKATQTTTAPAEPAYYTRPKPLEAQVGSVYADYAAYIEDLTDWKVDEREAKRNLTQQATQADQAERDLVAQVQARIATFKTTHPDYDAVIAGVEIPAGAPGTQALYEHLRHSDLGPDLAYALGQDQTLLTSIVSLPPGKAVAALGKLEGKIEDRLAAASAGPAATSAPGTKAKPPIKPVGSSPVTSDDGGDPDDLSPAAVDAYIQRENAKDRAARLAGRRR
jgi:hypothetical protein